MMRERELLSPSSLRSTALAPKHISGRPSDPLQTVDTKEHFMNSYAVIFNYEPDDSPAVYLFNTEKEAKKFLRDSYESSIALANEPGIHTTGEISEDGCYAKVESVLDDSILPEVMEIRLGRVYV